MTAHTVERSRPLDWTRLGLGRRPEPEGSPVERGHDRAGLILPGVPIRVCVRAGSEVGDSDPGPRPPRAVERPSSPCPPVPRPTRDAPGRRGGLAEDVARQPARRAVEVQEEPLEVRGAGREGTVSIEPSGEGGTNAARSPASSSGPSPPAIASSPGMPETTIRTATASRAAAIHRHEVGDLDLPQLHQVIDQEGQRGDGRA